MNIIACADMNWGIGYKGDLIFDIPIDKAFFKKITLGKTVIMGRKTFDSLPVRPLPSRRNIVLTRKNILLHNAEVCHSVEEIIESTKQQHDSDIFVIGGEETYSLLLPLCNKAYITSVECSRTADRHIYNFDKSDNWVCCECSEEKIYNGIRFYFKTYIRKQLQ